MDLAKIRKKARLTQETPPLLDSAEPARPDFRPAGQLRVEPLPFDAASRAADLRPDPALSGIAAVQQAFQPLPLRRHTGQSPLERILEGRAEAGCDEEQQDVTSDQVLPTETDFEELLCIRVSDETYGIAIMQIKEIITPRLVTEVPRVPDFVHGVISLRGIIIPVLDLVARLGLTPVASTGKERVVVVKSGADDGFTGLLVDQVTHVARVAASRIEPAPATLDGIDRSFVRGIGRTDNRPIPLLNIEGIVDIQLS